jgi:16S rRNA (cytosine967-C5)-methyltransferase
MKLCYGVLRRRQYLDQVLTLLCSQPLKKIKPFAYHALHTGLYQLLFLDRIPPSAAVNETVNAVIAAHLPKALQGFVNGVLRQSIRKRSDLPRPDAPGLLNHPQWLTRRWQDNFGEQVMKQICIANNQEPQLCLRVTPGTNKSEILNLFRQNDIPARPGQYAPDAVILEDYQGPITALPGFRHGYFHVQDQAAQLATLLMGPFDNGRRYLDCCAGVGGKTFHLLSLVDSRASSIVALEPHVRRARQLRETISRVAASSLVSFHEQTLEEYSASSSTEFNAILVDAPCSGTGVIGRHPDIRWNRNAHQLEAYQKRQLSLLENAEKLLVSGGIIVYATCSIEPEENYQVISRFLEQYPHYSLTDCQAYLPSQAHPLIRHGCFAPLPTAEIDGFFAARLTSARDSD